MPLHRARRRAGLLTCAAAVALACAALPATASALTFERATYASGERPLGLAAGHLDADTRPDVLVANLFGDDVSFFRGLGDGSVAPAERFALGAGSNPDDLELADLDLDGDLDAVATGTDKLHVLTNDGSGHYERTKTFVVGKYTQDAAVGDINEDGRIDVVAAHYEVLGDNIDSGLRTFTGQPDGTLAESSYLPLTAAVRSVLLADVDGDHHLDLVSGERTRVNPTWTGATDGVIVRRGDGSGAFGPATLYDADELQTTSFPVLYDFTGDGVDDLVAGHANGNALSIWPGLGDGTFGAHTVRGLQGSVSDLDVGDFDRDGQMDLLASSGDSSAGVTLYLGRAMRPMQLQSWDEHPYQSTTADLDGDGWLDIVVSLLGPHASPDPLNPDSIAIFRNSSAPPPTPKKQCEDGADNDGDGKVDVADAGCSSPSDDDESDDPVADASCTLCVTRPTGTTLAASSTATVTAPGGSVAVASAADKAVDLTGESRVVADAIGIAGGWKMSGTASFSQAPTHDPSDPGAEVTPPEGLFGVLDVSSGERVAQPGTYTRIKAGGSSRIHLEPGVYVVTELVSVSSSAVIEGTGVTLVLPTGQIALSGPSTVRISGGQVRTATLKAGGSSLLEVTGP